MNNVTNYILKIDTKISLTLFEFCTKNKYIEKIVEVIVATSSYIFTILYLIGFLYVIFDNEDISIMKYIFTPLVSILIAQILRKTINRTRPFITLCKKPIVYHRATSSMPSNHSVCISIIMMGLLRLGIFNAYSIIILCVLACVSRIMALVHYPLDVIFGVCLGISIGTISYYIL